MFDIFVAQLQCPNCKTVISKAEIQTYIRDGSADGSVLDVGFELEASDLEPESIMDAAYTLITPPDDNGPIRILDIWSCPQCETEQWAMVEIVDQRVHSVKAVKLDRATLESANFISDVNADLLAESLQKGQPATGKNSVGILRQKLP